LQIVQGVQIREMATDTKDLEIDSIIDTKSDTENPSYASRPPSLLKKLGYDRQQHIKILKIVKTP